jgi:MYXO-CTERM domain-containing protein
MSKSLLKIFLPLVSVVSIVSPAGAVSSAELYRTEPLGFGKFEARVQHAGGGGVISSFFMWKDKSEQSDVYWNELDFETLGATCELQTNSIYGLPQKTSEGEDYGYTNLCGSYHTYAYEWTPEYISWAVDGIEIRRDVGAAAAAYADNAAEGMQMRFNVWPGNASFGGKFDPSIVPVYEFIAWAQYSQYTPGVGDNGADFTLAWREEFDAKPAGWSTGSWESPLGQSTHKSTNVVFVDGIAVLGLTADDATGFVGSPPTDVPSTASGGAEGTGGGELAAGGGIPTSTTGNTEPTFPGASDGCSVAASPSPGGSGAVFAWFVTALAFVVGGRRRSLSSQGAGK